MPAIKPNPCGNRAHGALLQVHARTAMGAGHARDKAQPVWKSRPWGGPTDTGPNPCRSGPCPRKPNLCGNRAHGALLQNHRLWERAHSIGPNRFRLAPGIFLRPRESLGGDILSVVEWHRRLSFRRELLTGQARTFFRLRFRVVNCIDFRNSIRESRAICDLNA
jgi:hypothetical protein